MRMYDSGRTAIPENIKREIKMEAGHECSVTGCSEHTYLEIHHINQDREDNRKENLILLCDKHHKMAHAGVIDRKSLHGYKDALRARLNINKFDRSHEGDRVYRFLNEVQGVLSYDDCGSVSWVGSETGYWFEQDVYVKLSAFFQKIHVYDLNLRSYDQCARDRQDRIVDLLRQVLEIRETAGYRYVGGYCAVFTPRHPVGTPEYDNEVSAQKKIVFDKLQEVQGLIFELYGYVENR
ncbi:HNH endonuclease signature motif containing protein [Stenotrophomonas maltophilia]|uniref:HNH endonuclease signature motif containing protein n=1 Tax=Stenotrophomonas maltophilia TaxID=40324 RepID=UPI0011B4D51A|nr:HNH endonuclease signature motif containing protein [Stenotrophomonas maltophilia]